MRFRQSIYKTPHELKNMLLPGKITAASLAAMKEACRPGISTRELDLIAEETIHRLGGRSNFRRVPGYHHSVCASVNDEVVHGIPSDRRLQSGDIVSLDSGAIVKGWNGDAAITIVVDEEDSALTDLQERKKLSEVTEQALWHGIACLSQARFLNEVGEAIEDYVRSQGDFGILTEYVGHGIGRRMHEDPPVFHYRVPDKGPIVKPGLVVAIEPMIVAGGPETYVKDDGWTVATVDGRCGAHWEHSVAVHRDGVWVLTAVDGGAEALAPLGITPVPIV